MPPNKVLCYLRARPSPFSALPLHYLPSLYLICPPSPYSALPLPYQPSLSLICPPSPYSALRLPYLPFLALLCSPHTSLILYTTLSAFIKTAARITLYKNKINLKMISHSLSLLYSSLIFFCLSIGLVIHNKPFLSRLEVLLKNMVPSKDWKVMKL